jgi:hypothetical protein
METKKKRGRYTGDKAKERRKRQLKRQQHIQSIKSGEVNEELPKALVPEVFNDIKGIYWESLKSVSDPRSPEKRIYPLYLILHRIISGFIEGNKYIGVLFPKKRIKVEVGKKKLGALPTRKVVYGLLRRIDWAEANETLAPLWEQMGFTPDLVVRRKFRNPKEVLYEFRNERESAEIEKRKKLAAEREAEERSKGMSAAKAKRSGVSKPKNQEVSKDPAPLVPHHSCQPIVIQHDLVIDGKVVKASYNNGVKERFVHVTEIRQDENDNRSRFIIGAHPTELDRNGEWGAALSILDALTPLPGDKAIIVSGDAGFCVEEFCEWLNEKGFFLPLPDKGKRR